MHILKCYQVIVEYITEIYISYIYKQPISGDTVNLVRDAIAICSTIACNGAVSFSNTFITYLLFKLVIVRKFDGTY